MKILKIMLLCLVSQLGLTATVELTAVNHTQITAPVNWSESLFAQAFYHTNFVLTEVNSGDLMLVQLVPEGFIFNDFSNSLSAEKLTKQLMLLNEKLSDDSLYQVGEAIDQIHVGLKDPHDYIYFETNRGHAVIKNHFLIARLNGLNALVKVISKSGEHFGQDELKALVWSLNPRYQPLSDSSAEHIGHPFALRVFEHDDLAQVEGVEADESYPYISMAFSEEDRLSRYMLSSQCLDPAVPAALYAGVVLEFFGFNALEYNSTIEYRQQKLPLMMGGYSNSKGNFHTVATVLGNQSCQHVVAYVAEDHESLLDRFLIFIDQIEMYELPDGLAMHALSDEHKTRYGELLAALAKTYSNLEMHPQAIKFYQAALDIELSQLNFHGLIAAYYEQHDYESALALIEAHRNEFSDLETASWEAWCLVKLQRDEAAIEMFAQMFQTGRSNDEDYFQYLELLVKNERFTDYISAVEHHRKDITDKVLLDFKRAQIMTEHKLPGAQAYLVEILGRPLVANQYQFEIMDLLSEFDAYEAIITYAQQKIAAGFESALLLNYLGDAQNRTGDYEAAYASMKKAHELAPGNSKIAAYYQSLQSKVGKMDVPELEVAVEPVQLPEGMEAHIRRLQPLYPDSSFEYLYQIDAYHHQPGQKNKRSRYGKIKINTIGGLHKNKTLNFAFDSEYENISVNEFKVYDAAGRLLSDLDLSTTYVTNDNDGMLADHDKLLNIPVPSIGVGVTVEWVVTTENKSTDDDQGFVEMLFVSSVGHQYKGLVLRGDVAGVATEKADVVQRHEVNEQLLYWDVKNLPNYKKTPYLPDSQEVFPWLKLASIKDSWVMVGDDYLSMIEKKLNANVVDVLKTFGAGFMTKDDRAKAAEIVGYVQNQLTYQAIEFGWRAVIPNDSLKTLSNRYGDCKDHAVLLYDLLNAAGIAANLVLVNSDNDIASGLPNMGQFDHMIVYLPEVNGGVFVDVTDKDMFYDFNSPPLGLQGYHALVMSKGNSRIVQIPESSSAQNQINVKRKVSLSQGQYHYVEQAEFQGYYAANLRRYLKDIEVDELDSRIMSWVDGYYPDLTLKHFSYQHLYDLTKPLQLTFEFSQQKKYAAKKLPVFVERYMMEFTQSPNRVWDFEFKNPFRLTSVTTVEKGHKIKFNKSNEAVKNHLTAWTISATKRSVAFEAEVFANRKPAEDYLKLVQSADLSFMMLERLID